MAQYPLALIFWAVLLVMFVALNFFAFRNKER